MRKTATARGETIHFNSDDRLVRGIPISKFFKITGNGLKLKTKWSEHLPDCDVNSKVRLAVLDGMNFMAWKFKPHSRMEFSFPSGAMVMVVDGKLIIADKPPEQEGAAYGFPMTVLTPLDVKFIEKDTWANFGSDDMEATFVIHQPDGFKMRPRDE